MGTRAGDNNQLLALAEGLGWPFVQKPIAYNQLRRFPLLRKGLTIVAEKSRALIAPPWPDLVIGVGYGCVPVARYIRNQTNGRAKLVHVGNPRDPLPDFDLQITTPQYSRKAPNLLELPFPIGNPARNASPSSEERDWLSKFPRPLRFVAVGGPARFWELDHRELGRAISFLQRKAEPGSLIIAVSARTRPETRGLLGKLLPGPHQTIIDAFPRFGTVLADCDEVYVTADSVSMISEAVLSGKPVGMIPIRRSIRGRLSLWVYERPLGRETHPNFANFWNQLTRDGLVGTVDRPVASQVCDTVQRAADAVRSVMTGVQVPKRSAESPLRVWALLGAHPGDNDQIIALAQALGVPFEIKQLEYNRFRSLGPRLLGSSLISLTRRSRERILAGPPPDLTISAGHRSVAVVQLLRRRSGGRTRSIHLGFPRVSPAHFDLVIATPQYPIRDHPNLLRIPYALTGAATAAAGAADATEPAELPRPRHLLVVGGPTLYWRLDEPALLQTLDGMLAEAAKNGGSVLVTTSPRTPAVLAATIARSLAASQAPSLLTAPGEAPSYTSLLAAADSIRVTADSVSMISDAIWAGKPVAIVPVAQSALARFALRIADRIRPGLRLYPQDLRRFWRGLEDIGISERPSLPHASTNEQMRTILRRVQPIIDTLKAEK